MGSRTRAVTEDRATEQGRAQPQQGGGVRTEGGEEGEAPAKKRSRGQGQGSRCGGIGGPKRSGAELWVGRTRDQNFNHRNSEG